MEKEKGIVEKLGITPGPWEVTGAYNHVVCQKGNEDPRAIICESWERKQNENAKPENINIIAATPEMLEALIDMLMEFQDYWGIEDEDMCTEINPILKSLQAIQKATGKTWEQIKDLL